MKTVLTYGTFDLFHVGHVNLLQRARALGDRLIVGISTDEFNKIKDKKSIIPYQHRADIVNALKCVDYVFPENNWSQKPSDIKRFDAKILVMGHDWEGRFDDLNSLCDVTYLSRTEGISTTDLKLALSALDGNRIAELKKSLDAVQAAVDQLGN